MNNNLIKLNEAEQRLCKFLAKQRFANARNKKIKNSKIGKQSDEFTDLNGIGGEMSFCKKFNCYPDLEIAAWSSHEDNGDVIYKGKKIDVKTTKYSTGRLLVVTWKKETVDYYALIVGEFPDYEFKSHKETINKNNIKDLGYGETYAVEQNNLDKDIRPTKKELQIATN